MTLPAYRLACLTVGLALAPMLVTPPSLRAETPPVQAEIDHVHPLGDQLRVLAEDVNSEQYHMLVAGMNGPDLDAEWRRVETLDNPESFLTKHGGAEKVAADAQLHQAYQRRVEIRAAYFDIMRAAYQRMKKKAPFDRGAQAQQAGTTTRNVKRPAAVLSWVLPTPDAADHWPRFRGPTGQGHADGQPLPTRWSTEENVAWKTELSGEGNSSPVIWGDRLFLTTSLPDGSRRALHAIRLSDGKLLWSQDAPWHEPEGSVRDKNGYASSTPVVDAERVICYFGAAGLAAWDHSGKRLWHYETGEFSSTHGSGASPLLYEDLVILFHDQNKAESLCLALEKATGKLVWQQSRKKSMGWATPVVVRVGDHDELVYAGGETLRGYDPRTGRELWMMEGPTKEVVPTVVVGPDLIYSASGRQGPTLGVAPGGAGDVTESHLAWLTVRGGPHVPSPLYLKDRLYVVNDFGIASSLDAGTGEHLWQRRIRDKFSASGIEADGLLYFPSETGITYVIRAADDYEVVAENDLGAPILASPAALAGRLYLRAGRTLYCIANQSP